jgi:hypothetical protein
MTTIEYKNRKLTAKTTRNAATGERRVEVRCNRRFFCYETGKSEAAALDLAKLYVDEAEQRPAAYPALAAR